MATPAQQVSISALDYLTEFSTAFDAAVVAGEVDQWAIAYGLHNTSSAIKTTYPLPVHAAGYKERKGDDEMRGLYTKSVSLQWKEWVDGVEELASIIEAPDFIGWGNQPSDIAREGLRHNNELVAAVLAANPTLEFDGVALFADAHPVNVFDPSQGTFDNDHSYASIAAMVAPTKARFRQKKAMNGKSMKLRFSGLLVPPELEEEARDYFEKDILLETIKNVAGDENVAAGVNKNRHAGTVTIIVCDELTEADKCFPLDLASSAKPWIVQDDGTPEEIRYDKDSDYYKNTGKVGVKYVRRAAAVAALPHAIERITITG